MKKTFKILSRFFGVGLFIILLGFLVADFNKLVAALIQANYSYLLFALAASFVSVGLAATGFVIAANIFHIQASFKERFLAGWLGVAMNNLIMSGGAVGYGVRLKLLGSRQIRAKQILGASLFYSYVFQLFMAVALPISLWFFYNSGIIFSSTVKRLVLIGSGFSLCLVIFFSVLFFVASLRQSFFLVLANFFQQTLKRDWRSHLGEINELLSNSLRASNILNICLLFVSVVADWLFCVTALYLVFLSLGVAASFVYLFCAFVVSVAIGYVSVLPGGLGTQDLSLAGFMVLAGYNLQVVILVAVLFRLIYYIVPYGLASVYYNFIILKKPN